MDKYITPLSSVLLFIMITVLPTCVVPSGLTMTTERNLHPIILIPGSGGNQLEARLTDSYKPSSLFCKLWRSSRSDGWFRIWFDPKVLIGPFTKCFAERMTLYYHKDIDDYRNAPGVVTRVPNFGSTEGLLYLDPNLNVIDVQHRMQPNRFISGYMASLVDKLGSLGYKDNQTLYGAPYDFRYGLAPVGHPSLVGMQYLNDLTTLIEVATTANNGKPVILLAHSLGSLFALNFLNRQPPTWRQQHVKHLITLSAPWGGTVQEMLTYASGYTLGLPLADPLLVREEQRSSESNMWLLPDVKVFGKTPLVSTQKRDYTAADMVDFLEDIGYVAGVYPYKTRTEPLVASGLAAPGIPVTCIAGGGVQTPERLHYGEAGFDEQPEVVYGDGDGTVNWKSLVALEEEWGPMDKQNLKVMRVEGVSHTDVLNDDKSLSLIVKEIQEINDEVTEEVEELSKW